MKQPTNQKSSAFCASVPIVARSNPDCERAFDTGFRSGTNCLDTRSWALSSLAPLPFKGFCLWFKLLQAELILMQGRHAEADQRRLLGEFVLAHQGAYGSHGDRPAANSVSDAGSSRHGRHQRDLVHVDQARRAVQATARRSVASGRSPCRAPNDPLNSLQGASVRKDRTRALPRAPSLIAAVKAIEYPAYGLDRLWNACCWNAAAARLFRGWLDGDCQRNLLRYVFLEPSARELIPNWKDRARRLLAEFRADFARTFRDAQVKIFVEMLRGESAFFAEAWDEQAVQTREGGLRVFNHPHDGLVSFIQHIRPGGRPTTNCHQHACGR